MAPAVIAEAAFWGAGLLLAYTYLGYPALIRAWAALRPQPRPRPDHLPSLSVVVVAQDEAGRIEARVQNLLALDYPAGRVEVIVASDGSRDDTAARARAFAAQGVVVFDFPNRRGKPAVLNAVVPRARGEVVVLADARQRFEPGALRALAGHFGDPAVGAVSGELVIDSDEAGPAVGEGVGLYWRYEKAIRRSEGRVDSTVGATGAIYAVRRELFEPLPEDTLLDDVLLPLRITRRGYRALFEPDARAHDRPAASSSQEFRRKVRTLAGNFQLFARERWLLDPGRNRLWLQTVSHKGLRLLTPALLATALLANVWLAASAPYGGLLALQGGFYGLALAGRALRHSRIRIPLANVPYVICLLSWATVVALARILSGRQAVTWEKAAA